MKRFRIKSAIRNPQSAIGQVDQRPARPVCRVLLARGKLIADLAAGSRRPLGVRIYRRARIASFVRPQSPAGRRPTPIGDGVRVSVCSCQEGGLSSPAKRRMPPSLFCGPRPLDAGVDGAVAGLELLAPGKCMQCVRPQQYRRHRDGLEIRPAQPPGRRVCKDGFPYDGTRPTRLPDLHLKSDFGSDGRLARS
jgi:hypothetical protein